MTYKFCRLMGFAAFLKTEERLITGLTHLIT